MRNKAKAAGMADDGSYRTSSNAPLNDSAPSLERLIGLTVQKLRVHQNLKVTELAAAAEVSIGMLSKVESGQTSASLATLEKLAQALNVPMSRLFTEFDERRDCSHVEAGRGVIIDRKGTKAGHQYQVLGATLAGEVAVEPYLIVLEHGAVPFSRFQHDGTEFIYMLSGEVGYRHGESVHQLRPGDSLLFDSAALHGPETLDVLPAVFLSIIVYSRR